MRYVLIIDYRYYKTLLVVSLLSLCILLSGRPSSSKLARLEARFFMLAAIARRFSFRGPFVSLSVRAVRTAALAFTSSAVDTTVIPVGSCK